MEQQIFPATLLALPAGYVLTVASSVLIDRALSPRLPLPARAVMGAFPSVLIGVGVAIITAPAIALTAALAYVTVATALWFGMALRRRRWFAAVPTMLSLCGTWFASENTAIGVIAVVSVASLPVVALGYRLGADDSVDATRRTS